MPRTTWPRAVLLRAGDEVIDEDAEPALRDGRELGDAARRGRRCRAAARRRCRARGGRRPRRARPVRRRGLPSTQIRLARALPAAQRARRRRPSRCWSSRRGAAGLDRAHEGDRLALEQEAARLERKWRLVAVAVAQRHRLDGDLDDVAAEAASPGPRPPCRVAGDLRVTRRAPLLLEARRGCRVAGRRRPRRSRPRSRHPLAGRSST